MIFLRLTLLFMVLGGIFVGFYYGTNVNIAVEAKPENILNVALRMSVYAQDGSTIKRLYHSGSSHDINQSMQSVQVSVYPDLSTRLKKLTGQVYLAVCIEDNDGSATTVLPGIPMCKDIGSKQFCALRDNGFIKSLSSQEPVNISVLGEIDCGGIENSPESEVIQVVGGQTGGTTVGLKLW